MKVQIPPPANWQEFEDLCRDLWQEIWDDPNTQKNGRQGQDQAGVDVFGQPNRGDKWAGVQCKGKDNFSAKRLTEKEVKAEVEKAKSFDPALCEYIIATTGPRDAKIQKLARKLTEEHSQQGLFPVKVWSWEDIADRLEQYSKLRKDYLTKMGVPPAAEDRPHIIIEYDKDLKEDPECPFKLRNCGSVDALQVKISSIALSPGTDVVEFDEVPLIGRGAEAKALPRVVAFDREGAIKAHVFWQHHLGTALQKVAQGVHGKLTFRVSISYLDPRGRNFWTDELLEYDPSLHRARVRLDTGPRRGPEVAPSRLPMTGEHLFGRAEEVRLLDEAWYNSSQRVLSIVAWGGVGKTALAKHWLGRMAADRYRSAERVFDWSFYSQGTREEGAASADQFIDQALRFFGDPKPEQGSPYDKGERLARLVAQSRALLVLDGLEPLQYPPGPMGGQIKDPALATLIKGLAHSNSGLCVITTREAVAEIGFLKDTTAPRIELERLSKEVGAQLLGELGVKGTDEELQEASEAFAGHALALTLLGTFLSEVHNGDVRHWKEVPLLEEDASKGGHARRVMQSYQKWLGEGPEWSLLRLAGFFDRRAKGKEIQALLAEPPIGGLTKHLLKLDSMSRKRALFRLRRLQLLTKPPSDDPDSIYAHPLLREYLSEQLQQHHPDACREGHRRIYEHLKEVAKELPETLEEMMPLYQAVAHGCRGGMQRDAYDSVYRMRIRRGNEAFSISKLGAFGSDLAATAAFFRQPWNQPDPSLRAESQAWLLNAAGFRLRALGRLSEAAEPLADARHTRRQRVRAFWRDGVGEAWGFQAGQADIALEQSRLHHAQGHLDQARQSLSEARSLIQKHAYHRRDPELEGMEELLKG